MPGKLVWGRADSTLKTLAHAKQAGYGAAHERTFCPHFLFPPAIGPPVDSGRTLHLRVRWTSLEQVTGPNQLKSPI